ncbi:MAG: hypothetical protein F4Y97_00420 [Dehalococcoidia bacterium]|nr:hypothetical protein [Dehalococcoidia bacterium]
MPTVEQLAGALDRAQPQLSEAEGRARWLARVAQRELDRWGHEAHELTLEQVDRRPGSGALRCWFWCESCHISQLLVLDEPGVR